MEEAGKGLDWVHSKEKYKEYLKELPDISSSKSNAPSVSNPHVAQKRKAISVKKNLQLPQTKEKMVSADAEVNMVKEVVLQTDMPTVVSREPTTITGVQQIKGKTPLSTVPPKPPKQQKIVKFAKGTKGNMAQKGWVSETRQNCVPQPLMQGCQVLLGCCQLRLERCQLQIPMCQLMCQLAA